MKEILLSEECDIRYAHYQYNTILVFHLMQCSGKFIG